MERWCKFLPFIDPDNLLLDYGFLSIIGKSNNIYLNCRRWLFLSIPISPDRPIEVCLPSIPDLLGIDLFSCPQDNYLDAYLRVIQDTDPTKTALVFSCGMGAVRTTFAMVAASLVRRKQIMANGGPDPYSSKAPNGIFSGSPGMNTASNFRLIGFESSQWRLMISQPTSFQTESRILQSLEQANAQQELSKSLLRLTYLLQQCKISFPSLSFHIFTPPLRSAGQQ